VTGAETQEDDLLCRSMSSEVHHSTDDVLKDSESDGKDYSDLESATLPIPSPRIWGDSCVSVLGDWHKERRRQIESLFEAAVTGDASRLKSLLGLSNLALGESEDRCRHTSAKASQQSWLHPDTKGLYSRTALHLAADAGHKQCVELLLDFGASINAQTDSGFTPLHLACQRGHLELVQLLVARTCDLLVQADQGETPLHLAAAHGRSHVVVFLLKHSHLCDIVNNYGQRPCDVALDARTARSFLVPCGGKSPNLEAPDYYARRTLLKFDGGSVLLRNSRCDAVLRLLRASDAQPAGAVRDHRPRSQHSRSFLKLQEREPVEAIGPESFRLLSLLGKGSFGEVFQVEHKGTGQVFAMKVLRKRKIMSRNLMRYALTERNLLSYIRHPFIVRLFHAFQTPSCLVLVLQYCPGGNLSMLLQREGALPEVVARLYCAEVLLALEHLHERRVVYRDLKPENVVLDEDAHAVLTDFGLSKEGVDRVCGTKSFCGSVAYLAPEILTRSGHGRTVDLYGLGVLLFEMMEGQPPYYSRDRDTLFRNIVMATLQAPSRCTLRCADLISALMHRDPAKRIGKTQTSEVRSHPFFAGLDFDQVLKREVSVPPLRHWSTSFSILRGEEKVTSPFEGRFGRKVFRSWSSQDVHGWEFSVIDDSLTSRRRSSTDVEEPRTRTWWTSRKKRSQRSSSRVRRATTTFRAWFA